MFKFTSIFTLLQYQYCNGNCNMINKLYSWTPTDFMPHVIRNVMSEQCTYGGNMQSATSCSLLPWFLPVAVLRPCILVLFLSFLLIFIVMLFIMCIRYVAKATVDFVVPVRPSVWNNLPLTGGFSWNLIFEIFPKFCRRVQVLLKSDKNNRYFTWRPVYIYDSISLNSSQNEECFRQKL